jgi:hypothetical protein
MTSWVARETWHYNAIKMMFRLAKALACSWRRFVSVLASSPRQADHRFWSPIHHWLEARVQQSGNMSHCRQGTPQGGGVRPLLTDNDQWTKQRQ